MVLILIFAVLFLIHPFFGSRFKICMVHASIFIKTVKLSLFSVPFHPLGEYASNFFTFLVDGTLWRAFFIELSTMTSSLSSVWLQLILNKVMCMSNSNEHCQHIADFDVLCTVHSNSYVSFHWNFGDIS